MKLPPDWREFIELLNSNGVEYVVVGGHAVGYHGYPRYTGDIDFFVRADPENALRWPGFSRSSASRARRNSSPR